MKKIKFLSAIALTLALGACDNFDLPNPPGQTNPDMPVFENSDIVLSQPADLNIDLKGALAANEFVTVADITELRNFPSADYELVVDMQVGANDSFSRFTTVQTVITPDSLVTVNPTFLNAAIQEVNTKEPGTYDTPVRFVAYAVKDNTRIRLAGADATFCPETLKVTTLNPDKVLEQSYYLVPCDANGAPQFGKGLKMLNTRTGASVYDNPEFAVKFGVTQAESVAGYKWMLFPASSFASQSVAQGFGCAPDADNPNAGKLTVGAVPGVITLLGDVQVIVNVEKDTYSVNYALEMLYPFTGSAVPKMNLFTTNYINYTGVAYINNQWTLCGQPDKNGAIVFKQSDEEEALISEDGLTMTGLLSSTGSAQIKTPVRGKHLYWVDVNLVQLTYALTVIEKIGVVGPGNGWDAATSTELTPSSDFTKWTAKGVYIEDMFKLNCNGAWDLDFGGATLTTDNAGAKTGYISFKGSNIDVETGTYDVEVDFSTFPYMVKLSK